MSLLHWSTRDDPVLPVPSVGSLVGQYPGKVTDVSQDIKAAVFLEGGPFVAIRGPKPSEAAKQALQEL